MKPEVGKWYHVSFKEIKDTFVGELIEMSTYTYRMRTASGIFRTISRDWSILTPLENHSV
jgi:putative lipase involved disintegration of autophagic bodies